ncbi:MAG TPA: DUF4388 domain-containing protein [Ktedonobacterales bacterium]
MTKARVTSTDALANVIEVVELGQRTGMLSVERGSGSVQETGEIYFVLGRPMYASLAGLRGREALAALGRWGGCRFSFDRDALRPAPNLSPPSAQQGQAGYGGYNSGPSSGPPNQTPSSHPGMAGPPYGNPGSRPYESSAGWPMQTGMPDGAGSNGSHHGGYTPAPPGSGLLPGQGTGQGPGSYDGSFSQHSQYPAPNTPSQYGAYPGGSYGSPQQGRMPQTAGPLSRRPRRAPDVRDLMTVVTTHNLSRGHRTLLLLADGEHSVLDLARLSSKSVDEVMSLLADLESRSLVYYYG